MGAELIEKIISQGVTGLKGRMEESTRVWRRRGTAWLELFGRWSCPPARPQYLLEKGDTPLDPQQETQVSYNLPVRSVWIQAGL